MREENDVRVRDEKPYRPTKLLNIINAELIRTNASNKLLIDKGGNVTASDAVPIHSMKTR